ncbi:hypothetical protein WICPIJ_001404 [Wickerhamomyces pijperi]|uniref:Uncharacterized protein n=1 Tax=Wickerhamomyces pijperi TaxID=599730 RepID=A0A9P8QDU7_WICPI|nr:hypothetical protein WICPIJ_001404 [Wickerhamomyces pijperi]
MPMRRSLGRDLTIWKERFMFWAKVFDSDWTSEMFVTLNDLNSEMKLSLSLWEISGDSDKILSNEMGSELVDEGTTDDFLRCLIGTVLFNRSDLILLGRPNNG